MWDMRLLGFDLYFLFANFFVYSFFGWIYESSYVSAKKKCFINRGFLNGPVIPIYGAGATICYVVLFPLKNQIWYVFLGGAVLATALEFVTSYAMEKLFHAKWWDYSNIKFNIQGRVCLPVSLFWGLLAVLMTQLLQPLINQLIYSIPQEIGEYAIAITSIIFCADLTTTVISTAQLDKKLTNLHKLRVEIVEYIESTKLYETGEELKAKIGESSLMEFIDGFKERLEENLDKYMQKDETKERFDKKAISEEIGERIKSFKIRYQKDTEKKYFVQKRLLKAFPNLKTKDREDALAELKSKLFYKKK